MIKIRVKSRTEANENTDIRTTGELRNQVDEHWSRRKKMNFTLLQEILNAAKIV